MIREKKSAARSQGLPPQTETNVESTGPDNTNYPTPQAARTGSAPREEKEFVI